MSKKSKQLKLVDDVATLQRRRRASFQRNMTLLYWAMKDSDDPLISIYLAAADKCAPNRRT